MESTLPSSLSPPAIGRDTDVSRELLCFPTLDPGARPVVFGAACTGQAPGGTGRRTSRAPVPECLVLVRLVRREEGRVVYVSLLKEAALVYVWSLVLVKCRGEAV